MKAKIIFIATIIAMLGISIFATIGFGNSDAKRVHQHLEKKDINKCTITSSAFCSHLPLVSISTKGQKMLGAPILDEVGNTIDFETGDNGETMIKVNVAIVDNKNTNNHITDKADVSSSAMVRIRGNSSRRFDKSSYLIRFVDEKGNESKERIMGMDKHDEWALYGPYLDKSLIRNYMWMNISGEIMGYAPNVRFCEVFVDEEYRGLYVMMETIARSESRVNINGYERGSPSTSYIVRLDGFENNEKSIENFTYYTFNTEYETGISILYPGKTILTEEIKKYVESDISKFEKALYSYDWKDKNLGYRAHIDVNSFVDYYILQEFLLNNDMCSRSTYLYKDIRGKLVMGPVWDYNNVLNNFIKLDLDGTGIQYVDRVWYEMLLRDEYFVERVIDRYHDLRKTYLNEDYILEYIDETISYLGNAIERNYTVWGHTFEREHQKAGVSRRPIELNPTSYDQAVEELREVIKTRGAWLDKYIEIIYQYSHESKIKQFLK